MTNRRLVKVPITFELIDKMMRSPYLINAKIVRCIKGIPSDAKLVSSFTDHQRQVGYLVYSHYTFDKVPHGEELPEFNVSHAVNYKYSHPVLMFLDKLIEFFVNNGVS